MRPNTTFSGMPGRWVTWIGPPSQIPFRRYEGTEIHHLDLPDDNAGPSWDTLFGEGLKPAAVTPDSISRFFYISLALSAWKQVVVPEGEVASRWALRVNPSSGNLHPTEGYLLNADGVFHYAPEVHDLEQEGRI